MPWFSFRRQNKGNGDPDSLGLAERGTTGKKNTQAKKDVSMQFYTQLAHGGPTKRINAFMSLKELYSKLAIELEIDIRTVMFCTLNNPRIDMRSLLSGLVVYNDFIFVHVQGTVRKVSIRKEEKSIGITITDNSMGCCFVKRIRPGSLAERSGKIHVGDQLFMIDEFSLVGSRHFSVANKLKQIPVGSMLNLTLVEPKQGFDSNLSPRRAPTGVAATTADTSSAKDNSLGAPGLEDGRATVRIKSDGTVQETVVCNWLEEAKQKVDDLLESYMGIRDLELACTILEISDESGNAEEFSTEINATFEEFGFPSDFIDSVWGIIDEQRKKTNPQ